MARSRERIDETRTPDGKLLALTREEGYYVLTLDGVPLMSSAAHYSEEHLAVVGCEGLEARPDTRVLVGGLGMGYTLRAVLDRTSRSSRVVVAELLPAVVTWNRGPLGELADHPLRDERVELEVGDIVAFVRSAPAPFDAILLDTDNGPDDFVQRGNAQLYSHAGLLRLRGLLRSGGRLVVWSAYQCPSFRRDLERAGLESRVVKVKARGEKGGRHSLYVGQRSASAAPPPASPPRARGGPRGRRRR